MSRVQRNVRVFLQALAAGGRKPIEEMTPQEARAARIQGVVKLQVRISKEGNVMEATVLSGQPLLVPSALEAVKRYRYKPLMIEGKPYEVLTTVEIPFRLETLQ
jgi:TonB family protein